MEVSPEGVVIVSVYDRVPWGPSYVSRSSQHALLCSQTLHDLYNLIPCISKQLPADVPMQDQSRCVICIEGEAFSYHNQGEDYAEYRAPFLLSPVTNLTYRQKAPRPFSINVKPTSRYDKEGAYRHERDQDFVTLSPYQRTLLACTFRQLRTFHII